jgi:hypothetical protein
VLDLTEWFDRSHFPPKPWLVLGKGPTFERRRQVDLGGYNLLALNHVVDELSVDVAHVIDIDVVADCAASLRQNAGWLVMPRYPHVRSALGDRALEDYFDEIPVLRELDERGRLVWYNLAHTPTVGASPTIGARYFSSEAVLNVLGLMGVKTVRSLGVDGGRAYAASFEHLEGTTLLANDAPAFDRQFELLDVIADEHGLDYRPLVEPLRIVVEVDEPQVVAARVLEYSLRKSAGIPVEIVPHLEQGDGRRALVLSPSSLVFGDVGELADLTFGAYTVLRCPPAPDDGRDHGHDAGGTAAAPLLLVDGERLEPGADPRTVPSEEVDAVIPSEWDDRGRYRPGVTKLLHFADEATQPWKNDRDPLGELWMSWYREAVEAGAVPPHEVESLVATGQAKPALRSALRLAPSQRSVFTNASRDLDLARRRIAALEARIAAMEQSSSWRIGSKIVRSLGAPARLVRRR